MARESDPDSRPISVAEILARTRAEDERAGAGVDTTGSDAPGGRRRRGGKGSFSVSDLTGEQPRISGSSAHSGQFRAIDEATLAQESAFVPDPDEAVVDVDRPSARSRQAPSTFPRSERPQPTTEPAAFPRSEPPVARPPAPPVQRWAAPPEDATIHPRTRDLNSGAIADRFRAQAAADPDGVAQTGVIPRYEDHPGGPDAPLAALSPELAEAAELPADADLDHMSPQERERAYERYRNFEDIPADEVEAPKKRRGFLSALRRPTRGGDTAARDTGARDTGARDTAVRDTATDDAVTDVPVATPADTDGWGDIPDDRDDPTGIVETPEVESPVGPVDTGSDEQIGAADQTGPDDHAEADQTDSDTSAVADTHHDDTVAAPVEEPLPWADQQQTEAFADPAVAGPAGRRRRRADDGITDTGRRTGADTGVVDLDRAQRDTLPTPDRDTPAADPTSSTASPARQWLMLGLQVLAGLVVGVGLFLGFTELWRWNVYFALVLSIAVIFGLVVTVHVVRRSQDLISTLLALGVGLIVTIGPLVLLASGS